MARPFANLTTTFAELGERVISAVQHAGFCVLVLARAVYWVRVALARWRVIVNQMYVSGVQSFFVTLLFAGVSGMVLALQTGIELKRFGVQEQIGAIVALSMVREMGPLMTAIILLGRVGSSMAAELGTMKVSEEIDALEAMAIDPVKFLVMPREIAMFLVCPMLTVFASVIGILGGAFVAVAQVKVDLTAYFLNVQKHLELQDLYWGILKGGFFGVTIATIACGYGLRAHGGAMGVGKASRNTVVTALMLVIVFNYILSSIYLGMS